MCAAESIVSFIEMGDVVAARIQRDVGLNEEGRVFSVERYTTLGLDSSGNVVGTVRHTGLEEDDQGNIHGARITRAVNIPRQSEVGYTGVGNTGCFSKRKFVVVVIFMVVSSIPIAMTVIGIKAILDPKVTCDFTIEIYLAVHGLYSMLVLFVSCLDVCGICVCSDKARQFCHGLMAYFYISLCFDGAYSVAKYVCEGQIYNEALAFLIVMWIGPFIIICLVAGIIDEN